jgi:hypothetical protein
MNPLSTTTKKLAQTSESGTAQQQHRMQTTWPPERILLLRWLRGQTWTLAEHSASATPQT